ncbi:MAG: hypothetical protein ACYCWC_05310 [Rhodocyclaceae bacterium]
MNHRQRDIVAQRLRDLDKMRRYLDYSTQRMRQGAIAAREPSLLSDAEAEILAAFRIRFAEYQEHLGKLLKAIALEEGVALVGMADVLAFAEKARIIDSAEDWKEPRDVRNAIAHEYEEDAATIKALIARMLDLVGTLERIHERAAAYCAEKLAVPPAPTFGEKR